MEKVKAGFMFIELLLVLAIIMFILFKIFNLYFKKIPLEKDNQKFIKEQQFIIEHDIDIRSPKSIVDSTRTKLQDIQKQHLKELDDIKDIK